jgi:hypothetical protein
VKQTYEGVVDLLRGTRELSRILQVEEDLLESLIELLKPLHEATVALSADKEPTLPLVLPWYVKLTRCYAPDDSDGRHIKAAREILLDGVRLKYKIHDFHKVSLLDERAKRAKTSISLPRKKKSIMFFFCNYVCLFALYWPNA